RRCSRRIRADRRTSPCPATRTYGPVDGASKPGHVSATRGGAVLFRVPSMFLLIAGAGRVGSAVAKRSLEAGHEVSVLDLDPLSHERLDKDQTTSWEDAGGRLNRGAASQIERRIGGGLGGA